MSTSAQIFYVERCEASVIRQLSAPEGVKNQYVRTLYIWDDEGHKTEIELFATARENLAFNIGDLA